MSARSPLRGAAAGILIVALAMVVLAADQLAKQAAIGGLPVDENVDVIPGILQFRLVFNPGAAFSLGTGVTWVFTIVLTVVAILVIYLAFTRVRSRLWVVVLGGLLGGVLGNLTDRLLREPGFPVGHVVDFIYVPWMMPAIFNVADMFVVCGMIAVALLVLIGLRLDGVRERRGETPQEDVPPAERADPSDSEGSPDAEEKDPDATDADSGGAERDPSPDDADPAPAPAAREQGS